MTTSASSSAPSVRVVQAEGPRLARDIVKRIEDPSSMISVGRHLTIVRRLCLGCPALQNAVPLMERKDRGAVALKSCYPDAADRPCYPISPDRGGSRACRTVQA